MLRRNNAPKRTSRRLQDMQNFRPREWRKPKENTRNRLLRQPDIGCPRWEILLQSLRPVKSKSLRVANHQDWKQTNKPTKEPNKYRNLLSEILAWLALPSHCGPSETSTVCSAGAPAARQLTQSTCFPGVGATFPRLADLYFLNFSTTNWSSFN